MKNIEFLRKKYSNLIPIEDIIPKLSNNEYIEENNSDVMNNKMFQLHKHLTNEDVLDLIKIKKLFYNKN